MTPHSAKSWALAAVLACVCSLSGQAVFAQGGSAVITLVMPPPGGEGYASLQSGAALPQGAASLYYNPALLSELERTTGSQIFYSGSRQKLLPVLGIKDLSQDFQTVALVAPDPESGLDWAVGAFRNRVEFGKSERTDSNGNDLGTFDSYETVYGLGAAVRLGIPVSLGAAAKYFDSRLAGGWPEETGAQGWAFDIGVTANPRFGLPMISSYRSVSVTPSLALVARNLGPDVSYQDKTQADPIPRTYVAAAALKAEVCDMFSLETGIDLDQEWTSRSRNWDPVRTTGYSLYFLGFRHNEALLEDRLGKRNERHISNSLDFNLIQAYRVVQRYRRLDFKSPSREMDAGFPFAQARIWGVPFRLNPRLTVGVREIDSQDEGVRDGQKATFVGFSL